MIQLRRLERRSNQIGGAAGSNLKLALLHRNVELADELGLLLASERPELGAALHLIALTDAGDTSFAR